MNSNRDLFLQTKPTGGTRIKSVRTTPLLPGGRTRLSLFERVDDGRPHPRLRVAMPPATDPNPPRFDLKAPSAPPQDVTAWLRRALDDALPLIEDLDLSLAPEGSPQYWQRSLRVQRLDRFFAKLRATVSGWSAQRELRVLEDEAYAGMIFFDDADTGTYHSFEHDKPFVHYLEAMLDALPDPNTPLLDGHQQEAVRRQRSQARAHLDHLMRHKYAYNGIIETDIERSLGGLLIDRQTRLIVSETEASARSLRPEYELLRIDPTSDHPQAGEWIYRHSPGQYRLQDGTPVHVDAPRSRPVPVDQLSFQRAPDDDRLRPELRFDWDGNGYVQPGRIGWVSWAGHCDIKAIMEQLGVTLDDQPSVSEYRSDTSHTTLYDRALLIEMIASVFELGSGYDRLDGSGHLRRGRHLFGGARNDSRPDRVQFKGLRAGEGFRWPLTGRQDAFRVTGIQLPDGTIDIDQVFARFLPDLEALDFTDNPRFIKTIEDDYNLIDVSSGVLQVDIQVDGFDPDTGYPTRHTEQTTIDLREDPAQTRSYLGTHMKDASQRELYRVYLDRKRERIEAIPYRHDGPDFKARRVAGQMITVPLEAPLVVTLSREMKHDDPQLFQTLLDAALRQGQNICADTDMQAEVWNGVVTAMDANKTGENRETGVERWQIELQARFGQATLEYLLRRDDLGQPVEWCALPDDKAPDFLWQDFPDVASKGVEQGDWVVNSTMLRRGIVDARWSPGMPGDTYVHDDHIKNVYELIFCGLGEYPYTIVHDNKRYGFRDEDTWRSAIAHLEQLRWSVDNAEDKATS